MATVQQLIDQRVDRLDTVPEEFLTKTQRVQLQLLDQVLAELQNLTRTGGNIDVTANNLRVADQVADLLRQALNTGDYSKAVRAFLGEFDQQAVLQEDYFNQILGRVEDPELADASLQQAKRTVAGDLIGAGATTNFIDPARQTIVNAVNTGASVTDTITAVRQLMVGDEDRLGKLHSYAKTISFDALANTDATYGDMRSNQLGLQFYRYVGGLIKDSREFCKARNNEYYHRNEVQTWATGANSGSAGNPVPNGSSWQGRNAATTSSTIFVFRGGHNCKHALVPVQAAAVPRPVVLRNISNGNFVPNAATKKALNL